MIHNTTSNVFICIMNNFLFILTKINMYNKYIIIHLLYKIYKFDNVKDYKIKIIYMHLVL